MRKFKYSIAALIPLSHGGNKEIFKVEFYAIDEESAEDVKKELSELYFSSKSVFRPNPPFPRDEKLIDITD